MIRPWDTNDPEASWEPPLETLFHHILQKVEGYVVESAWLWRGTTIEEYSYANK